MEQKVTGAIGGASRPRVLLINDDAVKLQLVKTQLVATDCDIRVAHSATDGLAMACGQPPDLILVDAIMDGLDGCEVVRRLKSSEPTHSVPVLMITAAEATREKLRGLMAGADDFLTRPIDTSELVARVRSLLRTKMLYDQLLMLNGGLTQQDKRTTLGQMTTREVEAFTRAVSHDLRAQLRCIDTLSETLIDDYSDGLDRTATMHLIRIQLASQRMEQMIDDLVHLSHLAPGTQRISVG